MAEGTDQIKLQTAEALEEAARKLRNAEISLNSEEVQNILHGAQDKMDQYREELGVKHREMEMEYERQVEPIENIICEHPIPPCWLPLDSDFSLAC